MAFLVFTHQNDTPKTIAIAPEPKAYNYFIGSAVLYIYLVFETTITTITTTTTTTTTTRMMMTCNGAVSL